MSGQLLGDRSGAVVPVICPEAERDLIVGGATHLVVPGDRERHFWTFPDPPGWMPPKRWVDATGPCPTCHGEGVTCGRTTQDHLDLCGDNHGCRVCIDGRKRVALAVTCPTCGGDGGAFDRPCQTCFEWTGLMEGRVVFAHATVEVLPVIAERDIFAATGPHAVLLDDRTVHLPNPAGGTRVEVAVDPLPIPGRDWVVALDNVELT